MIKQTQLLKLVMGVQDDFYCALFWQEYRMLWPLQKKIAKQSKEMDGNQRAIGL